MEYEEFMDIMIPQATSSPQPKSILPQKSKSYKGIFKKLAPVSTLVAGIGLAITSYFAFNNNNDLAIEQAKNAAKQAIAAKEDQMDICKSRLWAIEDNNESLVQRINSMTGTDDGKEVAALQKSRSAAENAFNAYRTNHPVEISEQEYADLLNDRTALILAQAKHSMQLQNYEVMKIGLAEYQKTHPEEITQDAYNELQEQIKGKIDAAMREYEIYKQTHPEQITKRAYSDLESQLEDAQSRLNKVNGKFSSYMEKFPPEISIGSYQRLQQTYSYLQSELERAQQANAGSGDGGAGALIIIIAFVAIIAFITGGNGDKKSS